MKEKINTLLHTLSLLVALGIAIWYFTGDISLSLALTILIAIVSILEIISLSLIGKLYPESHVQFKIGLIAGLFVLLGIKTMFPSFFAPLTITVLAIDFFYNFYTNAKRKKGAFKRRPRKKFQL